MHRQQLEAVSPRAGVRRIRQRLLPTVDEAGPSASPPAGGGGPTGAKPRGDASGALRRTAGFQKQFMWCLMRNVLQRSREPLAVFTDSAIFALTGAHGLGHM